MDSQDETASLHPDPSAEPSQVAPKDYGPLKAGCERAIQERFPESGLIARCGLVVGPHDWSNRFAYWIERAARGGRVLVPGSPQRLAQMLDVRDLADWIIEALESGAKGVFNVCGRPTPMSRFMAACAAETGARPRFSWVDSLFLLRNGPTAWGDLPAFWVLGAPLYATFKARARGLRWRPIGETVRDTWRWRRSRPSPETASGRWELALLRSWDRRTR